MSMNDPLIAALKAAGSVPPSPDRDAVKEWLLPPEPPVRRGHARLTLLMAAALAILSGNAVAERELPRPRPDIAMQDRTAELFDVVAGPRPVRVEAFKASVASRSVAPAPAVTAPAPSLGSGDEPATIVRRGETKRHEFAIKDKDRWWDDDERDDDARDDDDAEKDEDDD